VYIWELAAKLKDMTDKLLTFYISFMLTTGLTRHCFGQSVLDTLATDDTYIYAPVETYPEFPGGENALFCFIDKHIDKQLLQTVDTTGAAWAQFTIDTLGHVTDIKIAKSLSATVDNELLRIIGLMPKWTAGKIRYKLVDVKMHLPLRLPYDNKFCR